MATKTALVMAARNSFMIYDWHFLGLTQAASIVVAPDGAKSPWAGLGTGSGAAHARRNMPPKMASKIRASTSAEHSALSREAAADFSARRSIDGYGVQSGSALVAALCMASAPIHAYAQQTQPLLT